MGKELNSSLIVRGLRRSFGRVEVLKGVDIECSRGEIVALIGRNGSGKSTVLNCISCRLLADDGIISLAGIQLQPEPSWRRARRGFAWTFQDPSSPVTLTVEQLLATATSSRGLSDDSPDYVSELAAVVASFSKQSWQALSFGQRKIAGLLISMVRNPVVLLLDEPVAGLSHGMVDLVQRTLRSYATAGGMVLIVEHNREFLLNAADRACVLNVGKILLEGPTGDIFTDRRTLEALI